MASLNRELMKDLVAKADKETIRTKDGDDISYEEFHRGLSKPVIDEIDRVLAKRYGFTDEEVDLIIINYDIKYRMGPNGQPDEE